MQMGVPQAGKDGRALEVHDLGVWSDVLANLSVRAHGDEATVLDGEGLRASEVTVDRIDVAVQIDL